MSRTSRRADVRATAARLFRGHGFSSATMDLIADEVGLNKGTLYHYYPSKSAILYELLADQVDTTLGLLDRVPPDGTAVERLRELVRLQAEQVSNADDELVLFFQEIQWIDKNLSPDQAGDLRRRIDIYRRFTQDLLNEGMAAGDLRAVDVGIIHNSIVGILAYVPNWFRPRAGRTKAQLIDQLADFVMCGIVSPAGRRR